MAKRAAKTRAADPAAQIVQLLGGKSARPEGPSVLLRHFSPDEHIEWAEANCYRDAKGVSWTPLRYSPWQKDTIRELLAIDDGGQLVYKTIMPCLPRRCGKSEITGLYDIHRADAYADQMIVIQANSEDQGEDTVLKTIVDTLLNSPALRKRVASAYGQAISAGGDIVIASGIVYFNHNGSVIKVQPAKESTTYGQKIHVYHNTELCKCASDATYQVGASSTGDAWCGVAIIDSNMGDATNPVARYVDLALAAKAERVAAAAEGRPVNPELGDPSIGAVYISFADLADVLKRGCGIGLDDPSQAIHPWLDAAWVRGRSKQMIRSEFLRNHCNIASGSGEAIWSDEQVAPLFSEMLPAIITKSLLPLATRFVGGDGTWAIGVGLDRAGAFSKTPDRSVLAVVGRTTCPRLAGLPVAVYDELGNVIDAEVCDGSMYVLLGAWEFMRHLRDPLQAKLQQIDRIWGIGAAALEAYQASDLAEWCEGQPFAKHVTVEHMTDVAKQQLVQFTHGLVVTRRFVASEAYPVLRAEMTNYREISASGRVPSYGGKRREVDLDFPQTLAVSGMPVPGGPKNRKTTWIKDDYLEAVMWAIYAARGAKVRRKAAIFNKPVGF